MSTVHSRYDASIGETNLLCKRNKALKYHRFQGERQRTG